MDTAGAMIGPLVAFGLLRRARAFDAVFVVSFCFAMIGLAVSCCSSATARRAAEPARAARRHRRARWRCCAAPRYRAPVARCRHALGLATISDGFLYLGLQRGIDFDARCSRCCTSAPRSSS